MEKNSFEWYNLLLLAFFYPLRLNLDYPKELKEIYNKFKDENGNIKNIELFMEESKPYIDKFYNDLKQTINIE